jgi:threonine synthase
VTVLVATSGDTGGAVANGFLGVKGVNVVILYPSGKVSDIQEKQLTTLGQNISTLEVNGTFDDCQAMVKTAFLDENLTSNMQLTSANSINVARWLPQLFYFMFAYKKLHNKYEDIVFSVPSGNFGNVCAGMMAQQLGLPIKHFIASNNENNVVTEYLKTQLYNPKPSVQTISNAMDVGDPSNFIRIQEIYKNKFETLKDNVSSFSFSDDETKAAMLEIYSNHNYVADPHGAVGYLGCKAYLEKNPNATRTLFYLANSYRDSLQYDLAIETYLKKIQIGGWDEETWNSYYTIGNIYYTQDNSKCIDYYLQAYNYRPSRAEPIYQIVKYYREKKNYKLCYLFDKIGSQIKKPTDRLFIENNVYDYKFDYEKTIYYYYLDLQTEGDQLCDHLIYNKNISNQNQQEYYNIVSNSIFYVKNISDYISIKNITKINLNYKDLDDYQITNPSIFVFNNRQLINLRNVNFYISPENEYLIIKNQKLISYDNICDTKNFLYEINKNTELTKLIEIKNNNLEFKKHKTLIDGIEDIRLIELNNKIYFIGTCRFVSEDNKNKMVLGTLNNNYETESLIELKYKDTECEKNWMPFIKDNKLLLVYSLSPLTILEPDLKTGICKIYKYDSKINYSEIRGGSQGILLDDYYYFIIHNVRIHNNVRHYLHRIIKLNQNLELVSISKSFYFIELGIEFVAGLCSYNNDVKISFGKHDNEAYICTLTKEEFIKLSEISIELK